MAWKRGASEQASEATGESIMLEDGRADGREKLKRFEGKET